mmetsp:Transcript_71058/g.188929  ORF Transcript_71058/g.188929 Transcript_71058/m.188929 type:complete len:459 (+) Transcript_71058:470-1846(+)
MVMVLLGPSNHDAHVGALQVLRHAYALGLAAGPKAKGRRQKLDAVDVLLLHPRVVIRLVGRPLLRQLRSGRPEQADSLDLVLGQRQHVPGVLQQDHGRSRRPLRHGAVLLAAHLPLQLLGARQLAAAVLVEPQVPDGREDPCGCLLHGGGPARRGWQYRRLVQGEVDAPLERRGLRVREVVHRGAVVRDHHALEAHHILQVPFEHIEVAARPHAVHLVGIAQDPRSAAVNRGLEWRVEDLPSSLVGGQVVEVNGHLLHPAQELGDGDDPVVVDGEAPKPRQDASQGRVLAGEGIEVLVVLSRAVHVDCRPKHHVGPQARKLLRHGRGDVLDHVRVPRGRKRQERREYRDLADLILRRLPAGDGARHLQGGDAVILQRHGLGLVGARSGVEEVVQGLVVQPVRNPPAVGPGVHPLVRPHRRRNGIAGLGVAIVLCNAYAARPREAICLPRFIPVVGDPL